MGIRTIHRKNRTTGSNYNCKTLNKYVFLPFPRMASPRTGGRSVRFPDIALPRHRGNSGIGKPAYWRIATRRTRYDGAPRAGRCP
jgi:hypothetical protein